MDFVDQPTETALFMWRGDSLGAERLCASILNSEGYRSVDPQCPLGGPDGLKDVVCELNGWKYVAAVFFPPTQATFAEVKNKFAHDLNGVKANTAAGIVFFTNQRLTPGERNQLESVAKLQSAKAIVYHLEAIRSILDSPRGYGMRLQYVGISMKPEEQLSFVKQFGEGLEAALRGQTDLLRGLTEKVAAIHTSVCGEVVGPVALPGRMAATVATRAMMRELVVASDKSDLSAKHSFVTKHLDVDLLCYIHRSMFDNESSAHFAGTLRSVGVWIAGPGSTPDNALYVPPRPQDVPHLTDQVLAGWRQEYDDLLDLPMEQRLDAIVEFHHSLLAVHPFLDGNGRLARLLLEQQARELLGIDRRVVLEDSRAYSAALRAANEGDLAELRNVISQALYGEWTIEG